MNSPETIASVLISFSTIGFVVLFGTATFLPMVYELTILRKEESVQLLRRYPYRLISRLGENLSIIALMGISLLFVIVGLLGLIYFITNSENLLLFAIYLSVFIVVSLLIYIIIIIVIALPYKEHEVNQIIDYSSIGRKNHLKTKK
ncbi:MAG: hypothetical protein C3F06_06395 [Candidatus Methanoperedenaceae archaeon]|nr:MAG: hypothetical protein C3F06_06395 [Candidatus Methanoperedenaceae archaeon]